MVERTIYRKLKTREVAKLEGCSTRALYDRIKRGLFPPPDFPSMRRGAPSYWLESTLWRAQQRAAAPDLQLVQPTR
ncbi:MAG: helix-turn-helix transcriptional regulator [Steroidobacteraceae bacterium]